jgi:hypothetical protein
MKKALTIGIILILFIASCKNSEIKQNKGITIGQIIGSRKDYRSNSYMLNYSYSVNNKKIFGESGRTVSQANLNQFMSKYFPVAYSTINPEKSFLIVSPENFKNWGIQFPDSLYWVKDKLDF